MHQRVSHQIQELDYQEINKNTVPFVNNEYKQNLLNIMNKQQNSKGRFKQEQIAYELQSLPLQIEKLVQNSRVLKKKNQILQQELTEKQRLIQLLKQQIHESILDETKNKLNFLKIIEKEAQIKAKQIINKKTQKYLKDQQKIEELSILTQNFQSQLKQLSINNQILEQQLRKQRKSNEILAENVVSLKQYIIQAMDEKDLIIYQLKKMILENQQTSLPDKRINEQKNHTKFNQQSKMNVMNQMQGQFEKISSKIKQKIESKDEKSGKISKNQKPKIMKNI